MPADRTPRGLARLRNPPPMDEEVLRACRLSLERELNKRPKSRKYTRLELKAMRPPGLMENLKKLEWCSEGFSTSASDERDKVYGQWEKCKALMESDGSTFHEPVEVEEMVEICKKTLREHVLQSLDKDGVCDLTVRSFNKWIKNLQMVNGTQAQIASGDSYPLADV